jgi:hypothetical protein
MARFCTQGSDRVSGNGKYFSLHGIYFGLPSQASFHYYIIFIHPSSGGWDIGTRDNAVPTNIILLLPKNRKE